MNKNSLLITITQKAYNIGFGAKKHFISYNIYSKLPRLLSLLTVFIGITQLLNKYKTRLSLEQQEYISVLVIIVGIVSLILDSGSKNKEIYDITGKKLTIFFNELHFMYNEIYLLDEKDNLQKYQLRLEEIEKEFQSISISDQIPFTHLYTNFTFFFGGLQIDWIDDQLKFKFKDKFPILHHESIILYILIICILYNIFSKY